jgi:hypothetical protein
MTYLETIDAVIKIIRGAIDDEKDDVYIATEIKKLCESLEDSSDLFREKTEVIKRLNKLCILKSFPGSPNSSGGIRNVLAKPLQKLARLFISVRDTNVPKEITRDLKELIEFVRNKSSQLLPYCWLGTYLEHNNDDHDSGFECARKLDNIFGDYDKAIKYLKKYYENRQYYHLFNDATSFRVDSSGSFDVTTDVTTWKTLAERHLVDADFSKALGYASKIDKMYPCILTAAEIITKTDNNSLQQEMRAYLKATKEGKIAFSKEKTGEKDREKAQNIAHALTFLYNELKTKLEDPKIANQLTAEKIRDIKRGIIEHYVKFNKKSGHLELIKLVDNESKNIAKILFNMAISIAYDRATEDFDAAKVLFPLGIDESNFDTYLYQSKAKRNIERFNLLLPPIFIEGEKFGCAENEKYYLVKISDGDPKGPFLGYCVGCCQSIGSLGESCAIHGFTQENGGFYVLCRGTPPESFRKFDANKPVSVTNVPPDSKEIDADKIIGITWAWRSWDIKTKKYSDTIVFDSIEYKKSILCGAIVSRAFITLSRELVKASTEVTKKMIESHDLPEDIGRVKKINVGVGSYSGIKVGYGMRFNSQRLCDKDLCVYSKHTDAKEQLKLYDDYEPWLSDLYKNFQDTVEVLINRDKFVKRYPGFNFDAIHKDQQIAAKIVNTILKKADIKTIIRFLKGFDEDKQILMGLIGKEKNIADYLASLDINDNPEMASEIEKFLQNPQLFEHENAKFSVSP